MTSAQFVHEGKAIDYTPSADVSAGDVVVLGDLVAFAKLDIAANELGALHTTGVFDVAREESTAFTPGQKVYWDADGDPEEGEAGTGAAVDTSAGGTNKFMGYAVAAVADEDGNPTVRVLAVHEMAATVAGLGDLSDVGDGAPGAGKLIVADADSWEAKAVSGLVTLDSAGEVGLPDAADAALGLPVLISKAFAGDAAEVHIFDGDCPRKLRIVDAWIEITTAGAAAATVTAKLDDGTDDITDDITVNDDPQTGYGAGAVLRASNIAENANSTVAVDGTLDLTLSTTTNAPAGVVRVLAIPVA